MLYQILKATKKSKVEFFQVAFGQLLAVIGGLFGVKFLTTLLSPIEYGKLGLVMTIVGLIQVVSYSPMASTFLRFFASERDREKLYDLWKLINKYQNKLLFSIGFTGFISSVIVFLFLSKEWSYYVAFATLFMLFTGQSVILDALQNANRNRAIAAWHRVINIWLKFLLAGLFIFIMSSKSSQAALVGYVLAAAIVYYSQRYFFRRDILPIMLSNKTNIVDCKNDLAIRINSYMFPIMFWGIFNWLRTASDRWVINTVLDLKYVGFYEVLYQIGFYPMTLLVIVLSQFFTPIIFENAGDATDPLKIKKADHLNNKVLLFVFFLTIIGFSFTYIFKDQLFKYLVATEYSSANYLLPFMVLSGGLFISVRIVSQMVNACFRTQELLAPKIVSGILGLVLSIILVKQFNLIGIIFAGIATSTFQLLWVYMIRRSVLSRIYKMA